MVRWSRVYHTVRARSAPEETSHTKSYSRRRKEHCGGTPIAIGLGHQSMVPLSFCPLLEPLIHFPSLMEKKLLFLVRTQIIYIYIYIYIFLFKSAYVKPFTTGYVMIAPGQTMDVLVTANQSPSQYYMLISPYYDGALYDFDESIATAVWQYNGNYTLPSAPSYPADLPHYDDVSATRTFTEGLRSLANEQYPIDVPHEIESRMFITLSMNMQSLCK